MSLSTSSNDERLQAALAAARDTQCLRVGPGIRRETAEVFAGLYGSSSAIIIADDHTFQAAGRDVYDSLQQVGQPVLTPLILHDPNLYAEYRFVEQIRDAIAATDAIPIAVGAGTISDLTKLAAHQCGRPYITVATAASMDGYTAFGASITFQGSKQTFECPAPQSVLADLEVIQAAPEGMNAAGYADLMAKIPAGADWLAAEACGVEAIDPSVWNTVQQRLQHWLADPAGVRSRQPEALRGLITGLLMTGFAMQAARSSRPASGAEHQFSHLWDMEHHTQNGTAPSHGFKVGIGSLASVALYEILLGRPLASLDVEAVVSAWPETTAIESEIAALFTIEEVAAKALEESRCKHPTRERLRRELETLKTAWPELRHRLQTQLVPYHELQDRLAAAGAPYASEQIGISPERLAASYRKAYHVRRRFTILDLARRTGTFDDALATIFTKAEGECADKNSKGAGEVTFLMRV